MKLVKKKGDQEQVEQKPREGKRRRDWDPFLKWQAPRSMGEKARKAKFASGLGWLVRMVTTRFD